MSSKSNGSVSKGVNEGYPVFSITGYFDESLGEEINTSAMDLLRDNKTSIVLDFSNCSAVNSLALAQLNILTMNVIDNFQGRLVFCNIKPIMARVFDLANLTPPVELAPSLKLAVSLLQSPA